MKHISGYLIPNGFDFLHCLKKIPLCCLPAEIQLQDKSWHFRNNFGHLDFSLSPLHFLKWGRDRLFVYLRAMHQMHEEDWWRQMISCGRFNLEEDREPHNRQSLIEKTSALPKEFI